MGAFGKSKGGGRRSAARTTVPLIAVITTLKESRSAVLSDVSANGARVTGPGLPSIGAELFLTIEDVVAFGKVVRSKGRERGIAFDVPLNPAEERILRHKVAEAQGLPPEIRAAFEDWTLGVAR
jgi:hypothetical protein